MHADATPVSARAVVVDEGEGPAPVTEIFLNDPITGLRGFVIVDTLVGGKAMGGVRMTAAVTPEQIRALARSMSMKFALGEVPIGGAKGGIVLSPGQEQRRDQLLDAFGRLVAPLLHGGIYLGTDMGISFRDRQRFMDAAGFEVQATRYGAALPCSWQEFWRECVDVGGYGVSEATLALLPLIGLGDRPVQVAIHGFGTMGRGAARHLSRAGCQVVSVADQHGSLARAGGLPVEALIDATSPAGAIDRSIRDGSWEVAASPDMCLESDVDVLIVASTEDVIRADNAARLRCRAIVEAANHPCTPAAVEILTRRGVAIAPGIVANAASAMTSGLVVSGRAPALALPALKSWIYTQVAERIRRNIADIWERSQRIGRDMPASAIAMARRRLAER